MVVVIFALILLPLVPSALLIWSRYFVVNSLLLHYCTGKHHFEFPPIRPIPWHERVMGQGGTS